MFRCLFVTLALLLGFSFSSCNPEADFSEKLIGKWEYEVFDLTTNFEKPEKKRVYIEGDELWAKSFRMKPMKALFAKDGFFKVDYTSYKDKFLYSISGNWTLSGDQLTLVQDPPYASTFNYTISDRENGGLKLEGAIDWDKEEENDDHLIIQLKKL